MFCETHKLFITFNKVNILEDISINIENEKTTVIIGKNGSGKTVLLRCINNLIRPTSGFLKSKYNIPIPMLFQKPMTFYGTIQYNFEILCNIKKKQPSLKWYHSFNLDKISKKNIYEVSSGEQQKIYLSRIMSIDPEVIIMDEPNQNLDKENDQKLIDLILNEKEKNKTIIFTLHNTEIVKKIADKLIVLDRGNVIFNGSPNRFF